MGYLCSRRFPLTDTGFPRRPPGICQDCRTIQPFGQRRAAPQNKVFLRVVRRLKIGYGVSGDNTQIVYEAKSNNIVCVAVNGLEAATYQK